MAPIRERGRRGWFTLAERGTIRLAMIMFGIVLIVFGLAMCTSVMLLGVKSRVTGWCRSRVTEDWTIERQLDVRVDVPKYTPRGPVTVNTPWIDTAAGSSAVQRR